MSNRFNLALNSTLSIECKFMCAVFGWMFLGLLISAIMALIVKDSETMLNFIFEYPHITKILILIDVVFVFFISKMLDKLSNRVILFIFILYAVLIGSSFSATFIKYTDESIVSTFILSGVIFGFAGLYSFISRKNVYNLGYILFLTLIGIAFATIVNYFLETPIISWITTYVGIIVFMGFTYQEIKRIKRTNYYGDIQKASKISALSLYISFIDIFRLMLKIKGINT